MNRAQAERKENYMRRRRVSALAATVVLLPLTVLADSATDWSLLAGGSYSWNGSSSSGLVGTNIPSSTVLGANTPLHNGASLSIVDGYLNFTSGQYNGTGSNWSWGSGGTLYLTGCIAGVTATACTGYNNVALLSDDFQSVQIVPVINALDVVFGNITGIVNPLVASYFGVPSAFSTASFTTAIVTSGRPGSGFSGANLLGTINADPSVSTPEYWGIGESLGFFAFVLAAFSGLVYSKVLRPRFSQAPTKA
jgi:hypothetical protein